jgi:hypothetical protein
MTNFNTFLLALSTLSCIPVLGQADPMLSPGMASPTRSGGPDTDPQALGGGGASYCVPTYTYGPSDGDFISHVGLDILSNTTAGTAPYTYYSEETIYLQTTVDYALSVTSGNFSTDWVSAWIDFDRDGIFEESERLGQFNTTAAMETQTMDFTVPGTATVGFTRLRVRLAYSGSNMDPCEELDYGETEDYRVYISDHCLGVPVFGTGGLDYITNVSLASLDVSSVGETGFEDFSNRTAVLEQGGSYTLSITTGNYPGETVAAWIDRNGDMQFQASEKLGEVVTSAAEEVVDFAVNVPPDAPEVLAKLRVRIVYDEENLDPCTDYFSGETEDYSVMVVASTEYCIPVPTYGASEGDYISSVELAGIYNNTSGVVYNDYTMYSTILAMGDEFTLVIGGGEYPTDTYAAWIDYNANDVFEAEEKLGQFQTSSSFEEVSITFTVPADATVGNTVLRIRAAYTDGAELDPCEDYFYGETEDYTVQLLTTDCEGVLGGDATVGTPCDDGDPNTGGDVYNASCECVGLLIDCEGAAGGDALPGTPCVTDGGEAGIWSDACACVGTVGIVETGASLGLAVFPNPVDHLLHFILPEGTAAEVSVHDAVGQLVLHAGRVQQVDVSELAAGQYVLVAVDHQGKRMHARFMKR